VKRWQYSEEHPMHQLEGLGTNRITLINLPVFHDFTVTMWVKIWMKAKNLKIVILCRTPSKDMEQKGKECK